MCCRRNVESGRDGFDSAILARPAAEQDADVSLSERRPERPNAMLFDLSRAFSVSNLVAILRVAL